MSVHSTKPQAALRPTVIFDIGGVLLEPDFMRACLRLERAGAAPAAAILDAVHSGAEKRDFDTGRLSAKAFAARFGERIGASLPYSEFADIWCDIFTEKLEVTRLLDDIARQADLMLLSNTDPLHIEYVRSRYPFFSKFGQAVYSYEVGYAKPARQIFEHALRLCAPGTKKIYFDDVAEYAAAARSLGLPAQQFVDAAKLKRDLKQFGVL